MQIGFIGAGQMATALAAGMIKSGFCQLNHLEVSDPNPTALEQFVETVGQVKTTGDNPGCAKGKKYLILAVKPQVFGRATQGMDLSGTDTVVISVMGGVRSDKIADAIKTQQIVRVMPNTPCLLGAGACGMSATPQVDQAAKTEVQTMLKALGICVQVPESKLDAVTGLSGSGPAYVFSLIQAMADGGVLMGLSRDDAMKLAAQTVYGAAKMVVKTEDHPTVLRDRVASPGGTTICGLHELESGGFHATVMDAVQRATQRSQELASLDT